MQNKLANDINHHQIFFLKLYSMTTNGRKDVHKKKQHLLLEMCVSLLLHACPVQRSERSRRFGHLVSGLLFCTTCCLAQPCLQRRGGRDREAGDDLVTCFIIFPLFLSSSGLCVQKSAEHPSQILNRPRADFRKHKVEFGL